LRRSHREDVGESRRSILQRQCNAVGDKADGVVPAAEHQQVEDLGLVQFGGQVRSITISRSRIDNDSRLLSS
jgi:hypothetical protein